MKAFVLASLLLLGALASHRASAQAVTYDFTGTVTGATGMYAPLGTGEMITGTYTIDYPAAIASQSFGTPGDFATGWSAESFTAPGFSAPSFVFSSTAQVGSTFYSTYAPSSLITMNSSVQGTSGELIGQENVTVGSSSAYSLMAIYLNGSTPGANSAGLPTFTGLGGGDFGVSTPSSASNVVLYSLDSITAASPASPTPEPGTYALMGAGLVVVGFVTRRRRPAARPGEPACPPRNATSGSSLVIASGRWH